MRNQNISKRREYLWYYAPLIFWIAAILFLSSNTGSMSNTSRFIRPILEFLFPAAGDAQLSEIHGYLRKVGHFTGYGILGFLAARAFYQTSIAFLRKNQIFAALVLVVAVAAIDETNQSRLASRTGSIYDVLLDAAGGLPAIFVFAIFAGKATQRGAIVRRHERLCRCQPSAR